MSGGVRHRGNRALRHAEQHEAFDLVIVDDRIEIVDPHIDVGQITVAEVAFGQAAAARVVADESEPIAEGPDPMPPHRTVPVLVDVGHPVRHLDHRRSRADRRDGEFGPVARAHEAHRLLAIRGLTTHDRRRNCRHHLDIGDHLDPTAVDGADVALRCAVVADRRTGGSDTRGQRAVGHEAITPDGVEDLRARHHTISMFEQIGEYLEHLRLDGYARAIDAQLVRGRIELDPVESVSHRTSIPRGDSRRPPQQH